MSVSHVIRINYYKAFCGKVDLILWDSVYALYTVNYGKESKKMNLYLGELKSKKLTVFSLGIIIILASYLIENDRTRRHCTSCQFLMFWKC